MLCNQFTKNVDSMYECVFIGISQSVAKGFPPLDIEQLDIIFKMCSYKTILKNE